MNPPIAEHDIHYAPGNIDDAIEAALVALGKDDSILTINDLTELDQFHTGGIQTTRALAQRAMITASDRVLDVGGGLGGPARLLAQEMGCLVTVVDLTEAYCRVGEKLTERVKLNERVRFYQGSALDLPFEEASFNVVWTQHSTMNIPDKKRLYDQIHRVLCSGGRLAMHEVTAGSGEPLHFPVLWSRNEAMNFLLPPDALHETIIKAGFREQVWNDITDWTLTWFQERRRTKPSSDVPAIRLGLHLLLGSDFGTMARNLVRNLQEGRVRVVEGVFGRL